MIDIAAVGDANGNSNPVPGRRSACLVDNRAIADDAVRNGNLDIVACQDAGTAQPNFRDDAAFT